MNHDYLVRKGVLATKGQRFVNFLIDVIAYYALFFLIGILLGILEIIGVEGAVSSFENIGIIGNYILTFGIYLSYFTTFETLTQRTPGKFISSTKVITENGNKITFQDAFLRSLCRLIPFEVFSFLGDLGRGWHDSITNTYVVDIKKFDAAIEAESEIDQIGKIEEAS